MDKQHNRGRWAAAIGLLFALAIGILAGSFVTARARHSPGTMAVPLRISVSSPVSAAEISFASGFSTVVERVGPAVVNIASSKIVPSQQERSLFSDPFQQFFGEEFTPPSERKEKSLGSGVIVSPDGYILTNNHVVGGASDITVTLASKREYKARIVGTDSKTDIAVVKVDAKDLPVVTLGDSSRVRVGEFALALGSPFGLSETVTMGIISAKGRVNLGIEDYEDFIQTDTAINPGNSGGALVNARGELIGINTAIVAGGSGNQGVGFAIPINLAREIMSQILKHGKVIRGYLGAWIQPVTIEIARAFDLPQAEGALLGDVEEGSPAAKSGLRRGDVIEAIEGESVTDSAALRLRIAMTPPGTKVRLKVRRGNSVREVDVVLTELEAKEERSEIPQGMERSRPLQGLEVQNLTAEEARNLGLGADSAGALVTRVQPGSAAEDAGLQRGDVIVEVNRKRVSSDRDFRRAAAAASGSTLLLVNREGTTLYIVVSP